MPKARLKVAPPGKLFDFTAAHPDAAFAILSAFPVGTEFLIVLKAEMDDPTRLEAFFENSTLIQVFEVLHKDDNSIVVQYALPFIPPPVYELFASGELPRFPVRIKNGYVLGEIITSQERLSRFKDALASIGIPFEVISVTPTESTTDILTDRQREFATAALASGYYDTPRRCTLTELAAELDVSKATASNVLHKAEEKMVKEFFSDVPIPDQDR